MKIKFNKNSVLIENEKCVTTFDKLFFKAFELPAYTADKILLAQIETAIPDDNGNILIDCDNEDFIKFLNDTSVSIIVEE